MSWETLYQICQLTDVVRGHKVRTRVRGCFVAFPWWHVVDNPVCCVSLIIESFVWNGKSWIRQLFQLSVRQKQFIIVCQPIQEPSPHVMMPTRGWGNNQFQFLINFLIVRFQLCTVHVWPFVNPYFENPLLYAIVDYQFCLYKNHYIKYCELYAKQYFREQTETETVKRNCGYGNSQPMRTSGICFRQPMSTSNSFMMLYRYTIYS